MGEMAFNGTVLEGKKRWYTVINERDLEKYVDKSTQYSFASVLDDICEQIEAGRVVDGKEPYNNYLVINLDEPYIDEVIDIMKRNGHMRW